MKVVLATTLFSVMFVAIGCRQSGECSTSGWGVTNTAFNSKALNVCFEKRSYADVELLNTTPAIPAHAQAEFSRTNLALVGLGLCGPIRNSVAPKLNFKAPATLRYALHQSQHEFHLSQPSRS